MARSLSRPCVAWFLVQTLAGVFQRVALLAVMAALQAASPCQRTWIVDVKNGPGTDFVDLPPAVQAAGPGDTLFVRAGVYSSATISKGITVHSHPYGGIGQRMGMTIQNIPAGQTFIGKSILVGDITNSAKLRCLNCQGNVILENCLQYNPIEITSCNFVMVNQNGHCVTATNSNVMLQDMYITSELALPIPIQITGGALTLIDVRVYGKVGSRSSGCNIVTAPGPGIAAKGCVIKLLGDLTYVTGGAAPPPPWWSCAPLYAPAILSTGGVTVIRDPAVAMQGGFSGPVSEFVEHHPKLTGMGKSPGNVVLPDIYGIAGSSVTVFASVPTTAVPTYWGDLYLDLPTLLAVSAGVTDSFGHFNPTIPIPLVVPIGLPVTLQGAVLTPSLKLQLTTPTTMVLVDYGG